MNQADLRTASLALDQARPIVMRLDAARNPEDVAADIIDAWDHAESALRALGGGSPSTGQAIIRDLRAREQLSLEQGHAMLGFLGARDRAARTDYRPTAADVQAVREGFQRLEAAVVEAGTMSPQAYAASAAVPPGPQVTVPARSLETPAAGYATGSTATRRRAFPVLPFVLALVLLAAAGAGIWWWSGRTDRALQDGIRAYQAGRTNEARSYFTQVAKDDPDRAEPHIFLARMARDEGNLPGALAELQQAIKVDQSNALAMREMGAYLYTVGRYDVARNFYIRALERNPNDREAQGFLGCTMLKLGRPQEAQRFLQRAGQGPWSSCAQQMAPPGMMPMQPGVQGPYPQQPGYPPQP